MENSAGWSKGISVLIFLQEGSSFFYYGQGRKSSAVLHLNIGHAQFTKSTWDQDRVTSEKDP